MLSLSKSPDSRQYRCYKKKKERIKESEENSVLLLHAQVSQRTISISMSALVSKTLMHFCVRHRKCIVKIIITSRVPESNILINSSQLLSSDVFDTVFHSSKSIVGQLHYFCNVHRMGFVARSNSPDFPKMHKFK